MNRLTAYLDRIGHIIADETDPTGKVLFHALNWFIVLAAAFLVAQGIRALIR